MKDLDYRIYCVLIVVIGLLIIFFLTGCQKDDRKCIKSHNEIKNMYFFNGRSMIFIPINRTICDEYEVDNNEK